MYSFKGIYYSQKAEWGFFTDSLRDLFLYPKLANKQNMRKTAKAVLLKKKPVEEFL